jgi:hypothetical protein
MVAEISYDLVMSDDMGWAEGAFRLPGGEWQVFIFVSSEDPEPSVKTGTRWKSGVTGVFVRWPKSKKLSGAVIEEVLSAAYGVQEWLEVRGPDSIKIR